MDRLLTERILTPGLTWLLIIPETASKLDLHVVWFDSSVWLDAHPLGGVASLLGSCTLLGVVLQNGPLVVPPHPLPALLGLLASKHLTKTIKSPRNTTSNINKMSKKFWLSLTFLLWNNSLNQFCLIMEVLVNNNLLNIWSYFLTVLCCVCDTWWAVSSPSRLLSALSAWSLINCSILLVACFFLSLLSLSTCSLSPSSCIMLGMGSSRPNLYSWIFVTKR